MKKIFITLVIFCAVFSVLPVCGCSQGNSESMTGGACSVKELNNLEKTGTVKGKIDSKPRMEVDLRPVKNAQEIRKNEVKTCLFGECLYKTILGE